jgi:hypothetical protein
METIKKILEYIWIGICYLFKGLWIVLRFILILIWRGVVWIWDFIVLRLTTRRTASGDFDRRFKSTQKIENKEMGCVGAVIVIALILWLIGFLLPDKNEENSNIDKSDTVAVEKRKMLQKKDTPTVASKDNKEIDIQDTTIDLQLMIEEDFDEEQEEEDESPCETEPIIEQLNYSLVDKEELPELPKMDLPTSNEAL